jgi:hypothetical protein
MVSFVDAAMMPDPPVQQLPVVNWIDSPFIWGLLDEGCNACCHSPVWAANTAEKMASNGFQPLVIDTQTRRYSGIGQSESKLRLRFPIGLKIMGENDDGLYSDTIFGLLDSNQMTSGEHPLLLSLEAQRRMGLIKDMATGQISVNQGQNTQIEAARCSKSGLIMFKFE